MVGRCSSGSTWTSPTWCTTCPSGIPSSWLFGGSSWLGWELSESTKTFTHGSSYGIFRNGMVVQTTFKQQEPVSIINCTRFQIIRLQLWSWLNKGYYSENSISRHHTKAVTLCTRERCFILILLGYGKSNKNIICSRQSHNRVKFRNLTSEPYTIEHWHV